MKYLVVVTAPTVPTKNFWLNAPVIRLEMLSVMMSLGQHRQLSRKKIMTGLQVYLQQDAVRKFR